MQRFKERLILRRNAVGWSQVDLAANSGVSERSIAGFESTGNQPSSTTLQKLAEALAVSPAWLMGGEHEPMMMKDSAQETEVDLWKRRAKSAEAALHDLKTSLRALLDQPSSKVLTQADQSIAAETADILHRRGLHKRGT